MVTIKFNHGTVSTKSYQVWVVGTRGRWKVYYHSGKNADCREGDFTRGVTQGEMEFTSESEAMSTAEAQCRKKQKSSGYAFKGFKAATGTKNGTAAYEQLRRLFGLARADAIWAFIKDELGTSPGAPEPAAFTPDSTQHPDWATW